MYMKWLLCRFIFFKILHLCRCKVSLGLYIDYVIFFRKKKNVDCVIKLQPNLFKIGVAGLFSWLMPFNLGCLKIGESNFHYLAKLLYYESAINF